MMTKQYLLDHIKALHPELLRGNYIIFDNTTDLKWKVLPNFTLGELLTKNKADTYTKLSLDILVELQNLRTMWGSGIVISSSYRSPKYNRSIDGATSSEHMNGNALDTYPANGNIVAYRAFIKANKLTGGRGYYNTFVHIDCGKTRTWNG